MDAFKMPLPAVWAEPIWLGVQILLILLAGYIAQRFVAKCLTRLDRKSTRQNSSHNALSRMPSSA